MNRILLTGALLLFAYPMTAQIPEQFTNLKVLPEEIDRRELVGMMRGFAGGLGVRCNHCHVGDDPDTLEGYDFASDEKETKRIARVMLAMTREINGTHLPATGRSELTEVTCATCHRGVLKPQRLSDLILATIDEGGVEAGVGQYRDLRESHYGDSAYDFSGRTLNRVAETLAAQKGDLGGAMTIIQLNLEYEPDSPFTLSLRARILARAGDREAAIAALERAIAANPDVDWLPRQLEELRKPQVEED